MTDEVTITVDKEIGIVLARLLEMPRELLQTLDASLLLRAQGDDKALDMFIEKYLTWVEQERQERGL